MYRDGFFLVALGTRLAEQAGANVGDSRVLDPLSEELAVSREYIHNCRHPEVGFPSYVVSNAEIQTLCTHVHCKFTYLSYQQLALQYRRLVIAV